MVNASLVHDSPERALSGARFLAPRTAAPTPGERDIMPPKLLRTGDAYVNFTSADDTSARSRSGFQFRWACVPADNANNPLLGTEQSTSDVGDFTVPTPRAA